MSSTPSFLPGLPGGIPTSTDFIPSVVFAAAFFVMLPVALWRFIVPSSRDTVLLRPILFILIRTTSMAIRAAETKIALNENTLIVGQVFLSIGTIMLLEPTIALTTRLYEAKFPWTPPAGTPPAPSGRGFGRRARGGGAPHRHDLVGRIGLVLRAGLLLAIALSIYSAVETSSAAEDPNGSLASNLLLYRKVVSGDLLAILGIVILLTAGGVIAAGLPVIPTLVVLVCACLLMIDAAYRAASTFGNTVLPAHDIAFWLMSILPEFLVLALLLAVNIKTTYPFPGAAPAPAATADKDVEAEAPAAANDDGKVELEKTE